MCEKKKKIGNNLTHLIVPPTYSERRKKQTKQTKRNEKNIQESCHLKARLFDGDYWLIYNVVRGSKHFLLFVYNTIPNSKVERTEKK